MATKRKTSRRAAVVAIPATRTRTRTVTAAPIINVRAPAARTTKRTKRRSSKGRGSSEGLTQQAMINSAIGGAAFGFIEKAFPNMPTVPILGKAGTVALACFLFGKKIPFARDIGRSAATLAGYQLARDGHVLGEVVPQVHGIAAQV
jgi:hypothetical protein